MKCLDTSMQDLTFLLQKITASLSLFGCLFIILTFLFIKSLNTFYFRVILYLSINDGIRSIFYLFPKSILQIPSLCKVFATIHTACVFNSIGWSMIIFQAFYRVLSPGRVSIESLEKRWIFITTFLVPVLCIGPALTNGYGFNYTQCSFGTSTEANYWRFTLFYVPSWMFAALGMVYFVWILEFRGSEEIDKKKNMILKKVFAYPAYMVLALGLLTVLRVVGMVVKDGCEFEWMYLVFEGILELQGFANWIFFVGTDEVWREIYVVVFLRNKIRRNDLRSISGSNLLSIDSQSISIEYK